MLVICLFIFCKNICLYFTQINGSLSDIEIYDFEIENPFVNNVIPASKESVWSPQNKIYKYRRVCYLSLGVNLINYTSSQRAFDLARMIPNRFAPVSPAEGAAISASGEYLFAYGLYLNNCLSISDRNTNIYPNWSDISDAKINLVYISKK